MKKKEINIIDLNTIENPEFLKNLSYKELDVLAAQMREEIVKCVSINGGHLASNLGVVEATIALCRVFDFSKDKIIFDVGHQCYSYKILTGRHLDNLRQSNGVSGFQKKSESFYDCYEAGHSSTSISAASGMALTRDLNNEKYDIVAFIGDASLVNGLALEALNNLSLSGHKVIIILNDNDMSITKPSGALANSFRRLSQSSLYRRSKTFIQRILKRNKAGRTVLLWITNLKNWFKRHLMAINLFDNLGLSYTGPIDGHDIKRMEKNLKKAKSFKESCVIHIKTLKGKGYKFSENDDSGKWHGVGPFDIETGELKKNPLMVSWSQIYADILENQMSVNDKIITIVPATGTGSCLQQVFSNFPNRIVDVGIAEEHALVLSGGIANNGYHPVVSMYSTFLQRAYDELSHDLARMNFDATILIDRSGLVGNDGNTHQGIYDEQFLYGIPNTVVAMASNKNQSKSLFEESLNHRGVFCIRYPRGSVLKQEDNEIIPFATWKTILSGKDTCVVSVGPLGEKLAELCKANGIMVNIISAIYLKPMDEEKIKELLEFRKVIIYDAYSVVYGFASILASKLMSLGYKGEVILKAIPDTFVEHASVDEQLKEFNLLPEQIIEIL